MADELGSPFSRAAAVNKPGRGAHLAAGDFGDSAGRRHWLGEAHRLYEAIGAEGHAARVGAELAPR